MHSLCSNFLLDHELAADYHAQILFENFQPLRVFLLAICHNLASHVDVIQLYKDIMRNLIVLQLVIFMLIFTTIRPDADVLFSRSPSPLFNCTKA